MVRVRAYKWAFFTAVAISQVATSSPAKAVEHCTYVSEHQVNWWLDQPQQLLNQIGVELRYEAHKLASVRINRVDSMSVFALAKLQAEDDITHINDVVIGNWSQVKRSLSQSHQDKILQLTVARGEARTAYVYHFWWGSRAPCEY